MRPEHPSGKPKRERKVVGRSIWRVPEDGYVTPRLRKQDTKDAIGFVHRFDEDQDE
jgi:hypothetical protein